MNTLDKGTIHVLGAMEWDGGRFHHSTQIGAQSKIYKLYISGILILIFLNLGWP